MASDVDDLIERCAKAARAAAQHCQTKRTSPRVSSGTHQEWRAIARAVLAVAVPPGSCVVRMEDVIEALDVIGDDKLDDYPEMEERLGAAIDVALAWRDDNGK